MALESQAPLGETLFIKEGDFSVPSTSMTVVDDQKPGPCGGPGGSRSKNQTRQRASWTRQEEGNFFNALRQVGKNFEKITCRVQSKNKNQVDHSTESRNECCTVQPEGMVNLGISYSGAFSAGEWADSLTNVSVGDLLSEASKATAGEWSGKSLQISFKFQLQDTTRHHLNFGMSVLLCWHPWELG